MSVHDDILVKREDLRDILVAIFTSDELPEFLDFKMNVRPYPVKRSGVVQEDVYELIKWADRQGILPDLIRAAQKARPKHDGLKQFVSQFPELNYSGQLLKTYAFDLKEAMTICHKTIQDATGLVGLVVCSGEPKYIKALCHRLEQEVGDPNFKVEEAIRIGSQFIPLDDAVRTLEKHQTRLRNQDVIRPVYLDKTAPEEVNNFWEQLKQRFSGNYQKRLIVLMPGVEQMSCPPNVPFLPPPHFEESHVHEWAHNVVQCANWADEIFDIVKRGIIAECGGHIPLKVHDLYEELDFIIDTVHKAPNPNDLRSTLRTWSQNYA